MLASAGSRKGAVLLCTVRARGVFAAQAQPLQLHMQPSTVLPAAHRHEEVSVREYGIGLRQVVVNQGHHGGQVVLVPVLQGGSVVFWGWTRRGRSGEGV